MENIKGILVTLLAPMENHIANAGEKLLGNVSSIKRRPDEKVYISGQMQRHAIFRAIERLNWADSGRGSTFVSNGDGIDNRIEINLRADLGGFMDPQGGNYTGRRTSPLSVTPAVALDESQVGRDLLLKLKTMDREHSLATREFSQLDVMVMNFFLDISAVSISKRFTYNNGFHLETEFVKHVNETERKRRVRLFLEATRSITDYANQARNATCGEPQKVLIVFDTKLSRKASRYYITKEEAEKNNILNELTSRGAIYFLGDDTVQSNDNNRSVNQAYTEALQLLAQDSTTLYDPCNGDVNVQTFAQAFNLNQ
ncbi:MAG: type I-PGING CRISPR-associated protein Cas7/Csp1 [Stygiobacter sp.]